MSSPKATTYGPAALVASLLLNAVFVSCGADAVTNPPVPQATDPAILAQLTQLADRIDSLETRLERRAKSDSATLDARLTDLEATLMGAGIGDPAVGLTAITDQLDYLQELTNWMVADMSSPSWEHCGQVGASAKFEIKAVTETKGRAEGFFGIDGYGNGGKAKARFDTGVEADLGFDVAGAYGLTRCVPINPGAPTIVEPSGPSTTVTRAASADAFNATMTQLAAQLGITEASAMQAMTGIGDLSTSAASFDLSGLGQSVPLPSGLRSIATDPVGTVAGRITDGLGQAQAALCDNTSNWGAQLSTVLNEACSRIANPPQFGTFFNTIEELPTRVEGLTSTLTSVCGTVQSMIPLGTISIPARTITVPPFSILGWDPQTYTTFPGFNRNLFAGVSLPACT